MAREDHRTDRLREALREVDFPADKDELIRAARAADAADDVIRALRVLPPVEYAGWSEVARSILVDQAAEAGLSLTQRAEEELDR